MKGAAYYINIRWLKYISYIYYIRTVLNINYMSCRAAYYNTYFTYIGIF